MSLKPFLRNTSLLVLREDETVMRAIEVMIERKAAAVLVGEPKDMKGIFSERDVMTRIVVPGLDPRATTLGTVMTTNVTYAREDMPLTEAIRLMSEKRIRHLPVILSDGTIAGMISLRYLLHDRINELIDETHALEGYLNDAPGG